MGYIGFWFAGWGNTSEINKRLSDPQLFLSDGGTQCVLSISFTRSVEKHIFDGCTFSSPFSQWNISKGNLIKFVFVYREFEES